MKTLRYIFITLLLVSSSLIQFAQSGLTVEPDGGLPVNVNPVIPPTFSIGQSYGGGIIFYIDSTGQRGLIAAISDQSTGIQWGCQGTTIGGTSTAIGTGQANTTAIVNGCSQRPIAASFCDTLVLNGYNDWFLPSKDELDLMNQRRYVIGGFVNSIYWSSSENNASTAWAQLFANSHWGHQNKNGTFYVRAIRAFPTPLTIGQSYGGGIIFYIDGTGQHGLIAATIDQGLAPWGCNGTTIGGTSTAIGTGQANTTAIIHGCCDAGTAARICNDLVRNGYDDWFLPSKDELNQMYLQRTVIGGFTNNVYWSSSEYNGPAAWIQSFYNGGQYLGNRDGISPVRAVRAF